MYAGMDAVMLYDARCKPVSLNLPSWSVVAIWPVPMEPMACAQMLAFGRGCPLSLTTFPVIVPVFEAFVGGGCVWPTVIAVVRNSIAIAPAIQRDKV